MTDARHGLEELGEEITAAETEVGTYYGFATAKRPSIRPPKVHLLPNYDEYVGSFREYWPVFDSDHLGIRGETDAFNRHLVVLDGQVVGGWRPTQQATSVDIETTVFVRLRHDDQAALEREAKAYARFIGKTSAS